MSLHYLGKREPENCLFSHALPCLDNDTAFGTCCRLRLLGRKSVHCSVAIQLAERSRLCAEQCEEARHRSWTHVALSASMTEKTISGVHVSPGSAETLVRRGGITSDTNHHLIACCDCCLSNISAKNYQNRLMCVEVIVCYISAVFFRQCTHI